MADNNTALGIINLTPLPLEVHRKAPAPPWRPPGQPFVSRPDPSRASLGAVFLKPFEQVDFPWGDEAVICISLPALRQAQRDQFEAQPALSVLTKEVPKDPAMSILTIDATFVRNAPSQGISPSYKRFQYVQSDSDWKTFLNVTNNTGQTAKVYWLETAQEHQLVELNHGQSWKAKVDFGWVFQFRNQSDEMIGMTVAAAGWNPSFDNCTETLVLTGTFLDESRRYKERQAKPKAVVPVGPARLIGEKRKSTPPATDPMFITASTVREEFVAESFNGLPNRVVRDVEIAGPTLLWSAGNSLLAPYHGTNASDIRTLTICADRMEVDTELRFPRTNVIIHARELVFNEGGKINTTPLPYAAPRAQSPDRTVDPDDPTNAGIPADENGDPTYRAANGAAGEPGGNITLYVHHITLPAAGSNVRRFEAVGAPDLKTPRFICRGGKGQAAEPGGLMKYEPVGGAAEVYGKTSPILAEQLKQRLKKVSIVGPYEPEYRWPGEVARPEDIPLDQFWIEDFQGHRSKLPASAHNPLRTDTPTDQQSVVRATIRAWDRSTSFTREANEEFYLLPDTTENRIYTSDPGPRDWWSRWVADGRNAYPGGWPGEGGKGGTVTSDLASAAVDAGICDMRAGDHGDPTPPVPGTAPPGPNPAYDMFIEITRKQHPDDPPVPKRPSVTLRDISGRAGRNAPGNKYLAEGKPGDQFYEGATGQRDDRIDAAHHAGAVAVKVRAYKHGGRNNDQMPNNLNKGNDLSWLHPAALTATVGYARMAYRNGYRDVAAAAIEPYYRLMFDAPKVTDPDARLALTAVVSMKNNLELNLDYYGNPPGWVPRLDALTNLELLKNSRDAAYETFYFAEKMLSDYETFEDTNALSKLMSEALTKDIGEARGVLGSAYEQMPGVLRQLDAIQQDFGPIETAIVELRNRAIAANKDKVMVQRFVSGALQLVGGVAKSLPIGQPFLGAAGGALGSIGEFDWNAEKPLDSARSAFASLGGKITTFVTDKGSAVEEAVTRDLVTAGAGRASQLTLLTRAVEDEEAELERLTASAETEAKTFLQGEAGKLQSLISETEAAIAAAKKPKTAANGDAQPGANPAPAATDTPQGDGNIPPAPPMAAANSFLEALKKQRTLVNSSANIGRGRLQRQLAVYQRQQAELEEKQRIALRQGDDTIKRVAQKLQSSKVQQLKATRDVEDNATKVAARKAAAGNLMTNLAGLGEGLTEVGGAVVSMLTPISDNDPTVVRLAEQMLVEDPDMRAAGKRLTDDLKAVTQRKKAKVNELIYWQRRANTSLAAITGGLATQAALSRQRQSLAGVLNPSVKEYLKQTRERAKDTLAESIYWFVKSHQYEQLQDVEDTFYNFDTWAELLRNQELEKVKPPVNPGVPAAPVSTVEAEVLSVRRARYVLSAEDFKKVGDKVFEAEVRHLGHAMLKERQRHSTAMTGVYQGCIWVRKQNPQTGDLTDAEKKANLMLANLAQGPVVFNFVRDFNKGSLDWDDARVVSVKLKELDLEPASTEEDGLTLTLVIEQLGDMTIAQKADGERKLFVFRIGRDDDPIRWEYTYNHINRLTNSGLTERTTTAKVDNKITAAVNSGLGPADKVEFREYHPALFSDYRIRFTDLYKGDGKTKKEFTINRLEMEVELSSKSSSSG